MAVIELTGSYYYNYKGVVTDINTHKLDRPKIRLLYNPEGKSITPIDINLVNIDDNDIQIESDT